MNFECLRTFILLAQCLNFTRASEIMYVSQSTISNRIRLLEENMQCALFTRSKSGVALTAEGHLFLQYAKQLVEIDKVAMREIQMLNSYQDHLNVASVQWIHDCWFLQDIVRYSKEFPDIAIHMTVDHGKTLITMLNNGLLDLAITSYNVNTNDLKSSIYKRAEILLVGAREKFGDLESGIERETLLKIPLIYSDIWANYLADISEHLLLDEKAYPVHCNMLSTAKEYCLSGLGCCFLPADLVRKELEAGMLVNIPVSGIALHYVDIYITYNRNRLKSIALENFLSLFPEGNQEPSHLW